VARSAAHVAVVQGRTEGHGGAVAWVDDARDVAHLDALTLLPFLDCKVLGISATRAHGRLVLVSRGNGGLVTDVEFCRTLPFETIVGHVISSKVVGNAHEA